MKWSEPWRNALRRQPPLRLLTRQTFMSGLLWTVVILLVGGMRALSSDSSGTLSQFASRTWIAPVLGFPMAMLLRAGHWLSPLKVSSGPRGIVLDKGGALALIPWESIVSYRIYSQGDEYVLELQSSHTNERERLYMPAKVNRVAIEEELRQHVRTGA